LHDDVVFCFAKSIRLIRVNAGSSKSKIADYQHGIAQFNETDNFFFMICLAQKSAALN